MRILIETKDGEKTEGTVQLKDESFVMVKTTRDSVRVFHWSGISDIKRIHRGEQQVMNLDVFRKIRE